MIEARSCERFKILTTTLKDRELAEFYKDLMISEAGHYTTFIKLAKNQFDSEEVDKRWAEWLDHEAKVISSYGKSDTIHG
jgi:tRNA-(ms[2]io[6]A)-hydroxylase